MFAQLFKFGCLGSLGLSLLMSNSAALAQFNDSSSGEVVVPTIPSGDTSTPTSPPINTPTVTSGTRFSCQFYNGQYTVMYQPQSIPGEFFPWAAPRTLGGGWSPQRRCEAIASRLELYRPDGLEELQTSVQNNENIVCVTTRTNPLCRIVLTVPRDKDPFVVLNDVFQNLITADSGRQTVPVNTYITNGRRVNGLDNLGRTGVGRGNNPMSASRSGINLKPFLTREDGGTLTSRTTQKPESAPANRRRLNPNSFR